MDVEILDLTRKMLEAREKYSSAKEKATELEKEKKRAEYALYTRMDDLEVPSFKHEEFGTIYRSNRVWCKIVDQEKATKFLHEQGVYDDIMQLEAKTSRLNKLVKKIFLDESGVVPESEIGITVTLSPMIGNRQVSGGGGIGEAQETPGL